jgi:carboxylesterase type B
MLREVRVENGLVRGLPAADPRITAYKGIPYAAPPVGIFVGKHRSQPRIGRVF